MTSNSNSNNANANANTEVRAVRIIESSTTGLPASYKYARKVLRVVLCLPSQKGWKSEKGVEVLWESYHYNPASKGPKSDYAKYLARAEAEASAYEAA
ncbi:hypothetical protein UFOVP829_27 [uncultured Caudovirales phage]|uniref:Uncharacterized protein n=1 Tax=uncultured Caudovirales phage TaxID=2100421 RepID=A0A6J5Q5V3_9CAUD|nr:hypothetical protein UFOVP493_5 [uncultured Caudovirales phage]CAB4164327.1 hypothetical protein UFOVP829_27 [uncultured Caudovirales phage]CAB4177746.1 hypothetical protein UFOVP1003_43 [uncultured Caudovirales phage]CAB4187277.1 hypothetical protein UFOVP1153_5 [uncultured Caudovirales phage]